MRKFIKVLVTQPNMDKSFFEALETQLDLRFMDLRFPIEF